MGKWYTDHNHHWDCFCFDTKQEQKEFIEYVVLIEGYTIGENPPPIDHKKRFSDIMFGICVRTINMDTYSNGFWIRKDSAVAQKLIRDYLKIMES